MTRPALLVASAFLLGALSAMGGVALLGGTEAHAEGTRVICSQVPQKPGQIDESFVANFMSEQLSQGRATFTSVGGVSTVLCAH